MDVYNLKSGGDMKKVIFTIITLSICIIWAQQKVLLFEFEPRGVDSSVIVITNQLLRDALNNTLKYTVVDPAPDVKCYSVIPAAEEAQKMGIPLAIIGSVMQLGNTRIISYQLIDVTSASVIFGDKAESPSIEEYPLFFERIAQAIVEKKPYAQTIIAEKVTTPEIEPRFKYPRQPYASIFLTAGYLYPLKERDYGLPPSDTLSAGLVNLKLSVSFETPNILVLAQMGMIRGRVREQDLIFDLGVHRFLGRGDWVPTVGGGIGIIRYSWEPSNSGIQHDDGLSLSAGIGMVGLRSYYFRLFSMAQANVTYSNRLNDYIPGFKIDFGLTSPSMGPDATVEMDPGCIGATIGGFFLIGLLIALTQ